MMVLKAMLSIKNVKTQAKVMVMAIAISIINVKPKVIITEIVIGKY